MSRLQSIIGLTVKMAAPVHDYLQILFSDGSMLNIYNNYKCAGCSVTSIEGGEVISVVEKEREIQLAFKGNGSLSIGMSDCDFNGPEAIVFLRKGEPPIIWN